MGRIEIVEYRYVYGFSILLVVIGHWYSRDPQLPTMLNLVKDIIYSFHIPLFFLCSGHLSQIVYPVKKVANLLKKVGFFYVLIYIVSSTLSLVSVGEVEVFYNPWSWRLSYAWFLLVYGLIRLPDMLFGFRIQKHLPLFILFCLFLMLQVESKLWFVVLRCLHWYLIGKFLKSIEASIFSAGVIWTIVVYGIISFLIFNITYSAGIGIGCLLLLSSKVNSELLREVGTSTFLIYLTHMGVIYVIKSALPFILLKWLFIPLSILIVLMITYVNRITKIY